MVLCVGGKQVGPLEENEIEENFIHFSNSLSVNSNEYLYVILIILLI